MSGSNVTINGSDGSFGGYLASPASGRGPGVVVVQEIFGVNHTMREVADGLAARGFFALAPDLFWRLEPGVQLHENVEAEWKHARDLLGRFDRDAAVKDIQAALDHLRALPGATGKAGVVGFCLGGYMAYLAACRTDSSASVGYYGVNIQSRLDEAKSIKAPLMLHIAGHDEYCPPEAQKALRDGLGNNPHVTLHVYPQMSHAFARPGGAHYDHANAELADGRTATFFRQHLS